MDYAYNKLIMILFFGRSEYMSCDIDVTMDFSKTSHSRRNRPFQRYGGHIELIRFKDYYRMPRGHEQHFVCIFERFSGHFFLKFSQNKIVIAKKILVPCLDVILIAFFWFSIRRMVFHCIFLGKMAIIIASKHGTRIFFSHYNLILRKL